MLINNWNSREISRQFCFPRPLPQWLFAPALLEFPELCTRNFIYCSLKLLIVDTIVRYQHLNCITVRFYSCITPSWLIIRNWVMLVDKYLNASLQSWQFLSLYGVGITPILFHSWISLNADARYGFASTILLSALSCFIYIADLIFQYIFIIYYHNIYCLPNIFDNIRYLLMYVPNMAL